MRLPLPFRATFFSLALLLTSFGLSAATITVTSTADGGAGSLRQAVIDAVDGDDIIFAASTDGVVIVVSSEIELDKDLTITGNGTGTTTLSGGGSRIFNVTSGSAAISDMTLSGGSANSGGAVMVDEATFSAEDVEFASNVATGGAANNGGGALANVGGTVSILSGCTFTGNTALGASGSGGAIINLDGGTLNVSGSSFTGNSSSRAGGAIEDASGDASDVSINDTDFTGNTTGPAPGNGGAIHISGNGDMTITGGSATNNVAAREGGAFWNNAGTMDVSGTSITGNSANGDAADDGGGGLFNNGGTLFVGEGTIISGNLAQGASGSGGGVFNASGGIMSLADVVIENNISSRAGGGVEDASGPGSAVDLSDVTLRGNSTGSAPGNGGGLHVSGGGDVTILGGMVIGNTAAREGGGLWNHTGTMRVQGTTIMDNIAEGNEANQGGGGIFNLPGGTLMLDNVDIISNAATGTSGSGGGILNLENCSLTIENSEFTSNTANRAGGAIEDVSNRGDLITISDTEFTNNFAGSNPGNGGAIHITGAGNINITRGNATGNIAAREGGAFWNGRGRMRLIGVRMTNNDANGPAADDGGGAIFNNGGFVDMRNFCILRGNSAEGASGSGGAIFNNTNGSLSINFCVLENNRASRAGGAIEDASGKSSTVQIVTSRIAENTAMSAPGNGGGVHISGNGNMSIASTTVVENTASSEGGGLWNGTGTMVLNNVRLLDNVASGDAADMGGGAVFNLVGGTLILRNGCMIRGNVADGASGSGGGILNEVDGTLTITDATFMNNSASRAGGGIEDRSGENTVVNLTDVEFIGNTTGAAPGNGGAIHISGTGDMNITGGKAAMNTAAREGGGFWNGGGTMTVTGVNIHDNFANGPAGDDGGGGLFNNGGTLIVNNSTVWNNEAVANGGGIFNLTGGTLEVNSSTISGNISAGGGGVFNMESTSISNTTITDNTSGIDGSPAATTSLTGTIVAGNDNNDDVVGTTFSSGNFNLIGVACNTFPSDDNDQLGTSGDPLDAMLDTLFAEEDVLPTHAPLCGSPAVNAGNPDDDSADQLGQDVFGDVRDIGSFELQVDCDDDGGMGIVEEPIVTARGFAAPVVSSVYPNPSRDGLTNLVIPANFGETVKVQVIDLNGKLISNAVYGAGTHQLTFTDKATGTYVLRLISGDRIETHRLILK